MAVQLVAQLYLRVGHDECSLVSFVSLEEEIKGTIVKMVDARRSFVSTTTARE
jgi:hypothetical protein